MLGKSNLSKFLAIFLVFFVATSCGGRKVNIYNSEIICPTGLRVMVRFARKDEVVAAIKKAALTKKIDRSSEDYTVIRLLDKRSFKIEKVAPEDSLKCIVREEFYGNFSKSYIKKYMGKDLWW